MTNAEMAALLREHVTGRVEWRVQHPVEKSYCVTFDRSDSTNPKGEAEAWLVEHQRCYPKSPYGKYEVAEVRVYDRLEQVALEVAEALEKRGSESMRADFEKAFNAQEFKGDVSRYDESHGLYPGRYQYPNTERAWCLWQAAIRGKGASDA